MENDIRVFQTGANRNGNVHKRDIAGFASPLVQKVFSDYMHKHRFLADGSVRDSDNHKKGIPTKVCFESAMRHMQDVWLVMDGYEGREDYLDALCGLKFNIDELIYNYVVEHPELLAFEDGEL